MSKKRQRTEAYKIRTSAYVRARRRYLKEYFVKRAGGKCVTCGYDKCIASLTFHHRDPSRKEFEPSRATHRSLQAMQAEFDKCDLLCHNCHSELHFDAEAYQADVAWFKSITLVEKERVPCKGCHELFQPSSKNAVYCCSDCKSKHLTEKYPDDFVEAVLLFGRSEVARRSGVSQRAVAKRFNKLIEKVVHPTGI